MICILYYLNILTELAFETNSVTTGYYYNTKWIIELTYNFSIHHFYFYYTRNGTKDNGNKKVVFYFVRTRI